MNCDDETEGGSDGLVTVVFSNWEIKDRRIEEWISFSWVIVDTSGWITSSFSVTSFNNSSHSSSLRNRLSNEEASDFILDLLERMIASSLVGLVGLVELVESTVSNWSGLESGIIEWSIEIEFCLRIFSAKSLNCK